MYIHTYKSKLSWIDIYDYCFLAIYNNIPYYVCCVSLRSVTFIGQYAFECKYPDLVKAGKIICTLYDCGDRLGSRLLVGYNQFLSGRRKCFL